MPPNPVDTYLSDDELADAPGRARHEEDEPVLIFPKCLMFNEVGISLAEK